MFLEKTPSATYPKVPLTAVIDTKLGFWEHNLAKPKLEFFGVKLS